MGPLLGNWELFFLPSGFPQESHPVIPPILWNRLNTENSKSARNAASRRNQKSKRKKKKKKEEEERRKKKEEEGGGGGGGGGGEEEERIAMHEYLGHTRL